jgi:hypothetical protein
MASLREDEEERKGDAAVSLDKLGALACAPYGPRGLPCPAANEGRLMEPPRRLLFELEPEVLPLRVCPPPVLLPLPPTPIGTPPTLKDVRYGPADIAPLPLGEYAELGLD